MEEWYKGDKQQQLHVWDGEFNLGTIILVSCSLMNKNHI